VRACAILAASAVLVACGGYPRASYGPGKVKIPVSDGARGRKSDATAKARTSPPPSGEAKESSFPAVTRASLANGMNVAVVTSRVLPLVHLRLSIRAGSGAGAPPGTAQLTAQMLKNGGTRALTASELLRRVETLGTDLTVETSFDTTVLSMAVAKDLLGEALPLLSQVVREPRFDGEELRRLKARAIDEAEDATRSSGTFSATWLVFRELYPVKHPYHAFGALPSQLARVDSAQVRDFYRRFVVPKATTLVLAGDVDEATAKAAADKHFGTWTGAEPQAAPGQPRMAPAARRVVVAHRPKSVQSEVFVAMRAPERASKSWPGVRVANQVLGGGAASRLFADVREQRSLAYSTYARIFELARGPQPLVVYAGTETTKTPETVAGLLENVSGMVSRPPTPSETETARRYLSDVFAIRMETVGAIADMVVTQDAFGLPDGYWDAYRKELREADADQVARTTKETYAVDEAVIVVAGDADVLGPQLARFGEVTVVDPENEFKTITTIPRGAP
jgi:zinc protease